MARIKIKLGINEIEIESRDLDINNENIVQTINIIADKIMENNNQLVFNEPMKKRIDCSEIVSSKETKYSELHEQVVIHPHEIKSKLYILTKQLFFNQPRTVSEIINQLRDHGWVSNPLDVSKELIKMVFSKEILRNSYDDKSHYFVKTPLLSN